MHSLTPLVQSQGNCVLSCSQENALVLLKRKASDKRWDQAMRPYWESLPQPGELMTKETFPLAALSLLQDDSMVLIHQSFTLTGVLATYKLVSTRSY